MGFLKKLFAPLPSSLRIEDLPKPSMVLARMIAQEIVENPNRLQGLKTLSTAERMTPPSFTSNYQQQIFETDKCRVRFLVDYYSHREAIRDVLVKGLVVDMSIVEQKIILAARDILMSNRMKMERLAQERKRADAEAAKQQKICDAIAAFQGIGLTDQGVEGHGK